MTNQVSLRRRVEKNFQKRVCSYCDSILNGGRNKIHLTQRRKHQLTQPKRLVSGCGEDIVDLRKYLSGLQWGVGRDSGEDIIDLRKYLSGLQWGVGRDYGEEIVDLTKYLCGLRWNVRREIVLQDDNDADVAQEGAEKMVEEKASEADDGDVVMNQEIPTSKSLNFDLNEFPPPEERGD